MFPALDTQSLRTRLKVKTLASEGLLRSAHPGPYKLLTAAGVQPGRIRRHAAKLLTTGALASSLMIRAPQSVPAAPAALPSASQHSFVSPEVAHELSQRLRGILPKSIEPLTSAQENEISRLIHDTYGIHAFAEYEGNRLNHSYGQIGAEQHLPRFPGDTVDQHDEYRRSGITPGRGAWGYFAPSKSQLTPDLVAKEKYYVAVQTLYLEDWSARLAYLRDWYKYRKVIVTNPANGRSVIAVVADSGPAEWTGKHFGGSPEVMAYLKLNVGKQKGPVVLYFVDDPEDKIALGPIESNLEQPLALNPARI